MFRVQMNVFTRYEHGTCTKITPYLTSSVGERWAAVSGAIPYYTRRVK